MTTGRYIINTNYMNQVKRKLWVDAPREHVWRVISDLGGFQKYNPMVKKSYNNTHEESCEGAGRVCEFHAMGKVEEIAMNWKEGEEYTLQIKPLQKMPFFKQGFAHFKLSDNRMGGTLVETDFTYEITKGLFADLMNGLMLKKRFNKGFEGILKGLKKHIEEGEIIENNSSLRGYEVNFA